MPKGVYDKSRRRKAKTKVWTVCGHCKESFLDFRVNHRKFCSNKCYAEKLKDQTGYWKGKSRSEETRLKISRKLKGTRIGEENSSRRPEVIEKIKRALTGRKSDYKGSKHWNWRGGTTTIDESERKTAVYRNWREAVFSRDDYTCQALGCGKRGGKLNADHIKPFALFPELRFELSNGRTLCVPCHRKTDTWGRKAKKPSTF